MKCKARFSRWLIGPAIALLSLLAHAETPCRVAFDLGSSGIRAGASDSPAKPHIDIDFLGPVWSGAGLSTLTTATTDALTQMSNQAGFKQECARVAGGFSAWRLALARNPDDLIQTLREVWRVASVPVIVIPPAVEGHYGYRGAKLALGEQLRTTHVLDIGGGSLQIAGESSSFGAPLGQKTWHRLLCQSLHGADAAADCALQPMSAQDLARARQLFTPWVAQIQAALTGTVTLTAISRPVSRGIAPAIARLQGHSVAPSILRRSEITQSIAQLYRKTTDETSSQLALLPTHAQYLLSDLLLVEGLLQATKNDALRVAELDLSNVPGLLEDNTAYRWAEHYDCYLQQLRESGVNAYTSDPSSCPK